MYNPTTFMTFFKRKSLPCKEFSKTAWAQLRLYWDPLCKDNLKRENILGARATSGLAVCPTELKHEN
jgi:hypothetical protein